MFQFFHYANKYNDFRGRLTSIPSWGKFLVFLAALPGILLILLSLLALGVSILALFLLTVPVYRIVRAISGFANRGPIEGELVEDEVVVENPSPFSAGVRKQVHGTVIE